MIDHANRFESENRQKLKDNTYFKRWGLLSSSPSCGSAITIPYNTKNKNRPKHPKIVQLKDWKSEQKKKGCQPVQNNDPVHENSHWLQVATRAITRSLGSNACKNTPNQSPLAIDLPASNVLFKYLVTLGLIYSCQLGETEELSVWSALLHVWLFEQDIPPPLFPAQTDWDSAELLVLLCRAVELGRHSFLILSGSQRQLRSNLIVWISQCQEQKKHFNNDIMIII